MQLHIVYMGSLQEGQYSPASTHLNMLQEVVGTRTLENILVRSYRKSFNGFAAKLTDIERQKLANMDGVVSIFPSSTLQLHTTRSWDFMGFNESVSRKRSIESNIIVGVFDTGIWPESESFSDEGFGPPPKKWKGACIGGQNFTCNNKIIGARYYLSDYPGTSTRDEEGHGSHTASTAAGNLVKDASFFGLAKGTARGGVPSARIAAYKVCYPEGCASADILSAFDDAIADGVDLITISIGHGNPSEFTKDPIAIGAFHAMAKGILTVNSAGNNGPKPSTTTSVAPWLFSVAASTTDRLILDNIILGNGKKIEGSSINPFNLGGKKLSLVRGKEVSSGSCTEEDDESCSDECLDSSKVKGKIVMCDDVFGFDVAREAGAAGSIMKNRPSDEIPPTVSLPASALFSKEYNAVLSYKNSTKNPLAEILKSETIKDSAAPIVTRFSARGPNVIVPEILKPDISAPGLNILAAYSAIAPAFDYSSDEGGVRYKIISGTSMACPHVTGTAAYVKTFHPEWSPSAIKSAIMTTASPMDPKETTDGEFAYGSGHINPLKAVDPGLVYETLKSDYIKMLCSGGLSDKVLRSISGDHNSTCPKGLDKESPKDLNYPSMAAKLKHGTPFKITFTRTVTNVGFPNSVYKANVSQPQNVIIKVEPTVLSFKSLNEKKSFTVTVSGSSGKPFLSSSLEWSDGKHSLHIVYMGSLPEVQYSLSSQHLNMLQEVVGRSSLENVLVRSYTRSFNGFAAKLTDKERQKLSSKDGVVSVFPSRTLQLRTTRSWDFMGFNESISRKPDILAAFDDAIADGVDLITISIGGDPSEFSQDPIAIGAFHAMAKGILTVNGAGNDGPTLSSVSSVAPWLFSVAASTTDRLFVDNIILGNGKTVKGSSVNSFNLDGKKLPLVRGREVSSDSCSPDEAEYCIKGCIDSRKVHGKILICENVQGYFVAVDAGAAGSIVNNELSREVYLLVSIPTSVVNSKEYSEVLSYKNSTKNPKVEILKSEAIKDSTAPVVARFSSRAWTMNPSKNGDTEFAFGSGHINPLEAINPGLVYETLKPDYIKMLCSLGLNDTVIRSISGDNSTCPKGLEKESPKDLNYPSMSTKLQQDTPFKITFNRTVTNVGFPNSVYTAKVSQPQNANIKVEPAVLSFKSLNEKKSFTVTVTGSSVKPFLSSSLVWSDGKHNVRSPIVVHYSS
ncbi:hypothetical protein QYF36_025445 [Acer negundo]|nr:hypothetical protein QYF36_025445 [Acer negundo]